MFSIEACSSTSIVAAAAADDVSLEGDQWWIVDLLWPPYVIGQAIIFLSCGFFYLSIYLSSSSFSPANLSGRRLDVYHTSTHGVAL